MDLSLITDYLYISSLPSPHHAPYLKKSGVTLILNMIFHHPASEFYTPPFEVKTLSTIDFPLFPIPLDLLNQGVIAANKTISQNQKVLVYCKAGRHRSVAMAACILISQGYSADEAMKLIKTKRPVADPHAWHIERRIHAFARHWQVT